MVKISLYIRSSEALSGTHGQTILRPSKLAMPVRSRSPAPTSPGRQGRDPLPHMAFGRTAMLSKCRQSRTGSPSLKGWPCQIQTQSWFPSGGTLRRCCGGPNRRFPKCGKGSNAWATPWGTAIASRSLDSAAAPRSSTKDRWPQRCEARLRPKRVACVPVVSLGTKKTATRGARRVLAAQLRTAPVPGAGQVEVSRDADGDAPRRPSTARRPPSERTIALPALRGVDKKVVRAVRRQLLGCQMSNRTQPWAPAPDTYSSAQFGCSPSPRSSHP